MEVFIIIVIIGFVVQFFYELLFKNDDDEIEITDP